MKPSLRHNESQEDYLEAILRITERKGYCRSIDIAEQLDISKPSVSVAMVNLRNADLIEMEADKRIQLTDRGQAIAERIFRRHLFFRNLFTDMGIDPETAETEACAMEHAISEDTFEKFEQYFDRLRRKA